MIDANDLEKMAKERPDQMLLTGNGVLKLIAGIRQLEAENRALRADAARYRFLRRYEVDSYIACGSEARLDAEIDAAISAVPEAGG